MARLGSGLGNVSASALVKSANSIATQVSDYQDKVQALQWGSSAQSQTDFTQYAQYLQDRITKLQGVGTLADSSKALSLTSTLRSAQRSYMSNAIQVASTNILEGNGSSTDKLNLIDNLYYQAVASGDMNQAQNLRQAHDTLSQTIQYQAQQAQTASDTLFKANQKAVAAGYESAASQLTVGLKQLKNEYEQGGSAGVDQALKTFVAQNGPTLKALGVNLPKGAALDIGSVVSGTVNAIAMYHAQASMATQISDPTTSASYADAAMKITSGITTFDTPAGTMSMQDAQNWAKNPGAFVETQVVDKNTGQVVSKLAPAGVMGYSLDQNGNPVPQYGGDTLTSYDRLAGSSQGQQTQKTLQQQLQKLGFGNVKAEGGRLTGELTNQTAKWIDPKNLGANVNEKLIFTVNPNGGLQVVNNGKLFNLAIDSKGLGALYQAGAGGINTMVHGQYGFDPNNNSLVNNTINNLPTGGARVPQMPSVLSSTPLGHLAAPALGGAPTMAQRQGGGYNFTNNGQAISAAQYSKLTNTPFRTLLQTMANAGDSGARAALGFVGNDYGYDPTKVAANTWQAHLYSSLTSGVGKAIPGMQSAPVNPGSSNFASPNMNIGGGK